jgi:hypothetical protein
VDDHGKTDQHRALGRRRRVRALQRDVLAKDEADERRVLGEIDKRLAGSRFEF